MTKDLRETVIDRLQSENMLHMQYFSNLRELKNSCKTACCIAGHIVAAAYELNIRVPATSTSYPPIGDADYDGERHHPVAAAARAVWASQYGKEEANRLRFTEDGWGSEIQDVTAEEAIAHLNGSEPVVHGLPWDSEDA